MSWLLPTGALSYSFNNQTLITHLRTCPGLVFCRRDQTRGRVPVEIQCLSWEFQELRLLHHLQNPLLSDKSRKGIMKGPFINAEGHFSVKETHSRFWHTHTRKANDTLSTARPIKKHLAQQPPSGINTPPTGHVSFLEKLLITLRETWDWNNQ